METGWREGRLERSKMSGANWKIWGGKVDRLDQGVSSGDRKKWTCSGYVIVAK